MVHTSIYGWTRHEDLTRFDSLYSGHSLDQTLHFWPTKPLASTRQHVTFANQTRGNPASLVIDAFVPTEVSEVMGVPQNHPC